MTAFARDCSLRLPRFLDGEDLAFIQRRIEVDGFHERVHDGLPSRPVDLGLNDGLVSGLFALMMNDSRLLEFARAITGLDAIQSFSGSVQRRVPSAGHDDEWHDDRSEGRLAVLTINLGSEPFEGGLLQIRRFPDGPTVSEIKNDRPGDAVLFALGDDLEHRVTPPEGHVARTVYAGWFRTVPVREVISLARP